MADLPLDHRHGRHRCGGRGDRARLRWNQPRGHLGAALLRDRAAPAGVARHPRLPRRPTRHGSRRACRVPQRAAGRRQEGGGREGRAHRCRCRRGGSDGHVARSRRSSDRRLRHARRRLSRPARARGRQGAVRGGDEPGERARERRRRAHRRRRVHRTLAAARSHSRRASGGWRPMPSCSRWRTRHRVAPRRSRASRR